MKGAWRRLRGAWNSSTDANTDVDADACADVDNDAADAAAADADADTDVLLPVATGGMTYMERLGCLSTVRVGLPPLPTPR
mmetsp:Transcript_1726/g.3754  ORF Transcript_1726/g.3754 Transcript_1726/m.3754 type:complete len:81 (-) Transcript_1726:123-365(-)